MSGQCWSCRQHPAVMPDGRCQTCAAVPPSGAPTQSMPGMPQGVAPQGVPPQPYPAPGAPGAVPGGYPPFPQAAGMPFVPSVQFASPKGLATAITALLGVTIAALAIALLTSANMSTVLSDIESGDPSIGQQEYNDANDAMAGGNVLVALMMVATCIVFVIWFHRVRSNAEIFEPHGQYLSRGWAIGSWFVPVVWFWFPLRIANRVWRSSTPWGGSTKLVLVAWWWALWVVFFSLLIISRMLTGSGDEYFNSQDEFDRVQTGVSFNVTASLVGIGAAILAILVVRRLTKRQLTKFEQGPAPQPAAPGAGPYPGPMGGPMPGPAGPVGPGAPASPYAPPPGGAPQGPPAPY